MSALPKCPICTDCFHDISRIPRRMPCCDRLICEACLETYNPKCFNLCPLCRRQRQLSDRMQYLPIQVLIFRFVEVLRTRSIDHPYCTACPNRNTAICSCVTCNVYLCQSCLAVHTQNKLLKKHKIFSFEENESLQSARTAIIAADVQHWDTSKLSKKLDIIKQRIDTFSEIESNVEKSREIAIGQINNCFNELIDELKQRRATLVSQVESKADRERTSITVVRESHKSAQVRQQNITHHPSSPPTDVLLKEPSDELQYDRLGISFISDSLHQLTDMVKAAGQVRTVTFRPARPYWIPDTVRYNDMQIYPADFPQVPDMHMTLPGKEGRILCPHLEFDLNTANGNITVSATVVTNNKPDSLPPDTGCRLQEAILVLASRPLFITRGERVMYQINVKYSLKHVIRANLWIFETALTSSPVDANYVQPGELSVGVATCTTHPNQLCLVVQHERRLLADVPLTRNTIGVSCDLHLCIFVDADTNMIHIVDVDDAKVIASVVDVVFDKPIWITMGVETPELSDIRGELVSGTNVNTSRDLIELLSILHLHLF